MHMFMLCAYVTVFFLVYSSPECRVVKLCTAMIVSQQNGQYCREYYRAQLYVKIALCCTCSSTQMLGGYSRRITGCVHCDQEECWGTTPTGKDR